MWIFYALLSSVAYTVAIISQKKALVKRSALEFTTVIAILSVVLFLPFLYWVHFDLSLLIYGLILLSSILWTVIYFIQNKIFKDNDISWVSPFLNFTPLFVFALALIFFRERITVYQLIGMLILILGGYLLQVEKGSFNVRSVFDPFKKMIKNRHFIYLMASLLLMAVGTILDKIILNQHVTPLSYLFIFRGIVMVNCILYFLIRNGFNRKGAKRLFNGIKRTDKSMIIVSASYLASVLAYFVAIISGLVSLVVAIVYQLPTVFATIIGGRLMKEKRILYKTVICALMIVGAILIIIQF